MRLTKSGNDLGLDLQAGMVADETLDSKLENEHCVRLTKCGSDLGLDLQAGMVADETLGSTLENEQSLFSENSGMSIV